MKRKRSVVNSQAGQRAVVDRALLAIMGSRSPAARKGGGAMMTPISPLGAGATSTASPGPAGVDAGAASNALALANTNNKVAGESSQDLLGGDVELT